MNERTAGEGIASARCWIRCPAGRRRRRPRFPHSTPDVQGCRLSGERCRDGGPFCKVRARSARDARPRVLGHIRDACGRCRVHSWRRFDRVPDGAPARRPVPHQPSRFQRGGRLTYPNGWRPVRQGLGRGPELNDGRGEDIVQFTRPSHVKTRSRRAPHRNRDLAALTAAAHGRGPASSGGLPAADHRHPDRLPGPTGRHRVQVRQSRRRRTFRAPGACAARRSRGHGRP